MRGHGVGPSACDGRSERIAPFAGERPAEEKA
jgi:hypothetical protein